MNSTNKKINYSDGTSSLVEISSTDNYHVNLNNKYVIANNYTKNKNNSLFTSDIGVNSRGFASITILASIISVIAFIIMILSFRI